MSPRVKRVSGSKKFRLSPQKDFCNTIRGKADLALGRFAEANETSGMVGRLNVVGVPIGTDANCLPAAFGRNRITLATHRYHPINER